MDDLAPPPAAGTDPASDPSWVAPVTWTGFALAVIGGLQIIFATLAGLTVELDPRLRLSAAYKVGYSFLTFLDDFPVGVVLVLAVVLLMLPRLAGTAPSGRDDRLTGLTLGIVGVFSFLLLVLTVLAALSRLRVLDIQGRDVSSAIQWVLFSFVVRHGGTATIAFVLSLIGIRRRIDLGPVPAPYGERAPTTAPE